MNFWTQHHIKNEQPYLMADPISQSAVANALETVYLFSKLLLSTCLIAYDAGNSTFARKTPRWQSANGANELKAIDSPTSAAATGHSIMMPGHAIVIIFYHRRFRD
ncbi:hypothetical protein ACI2JR_02855 [Klebsiella sp. NPDC088457]